MYRTGYQPGGVNSRISVNPGQMGPMFNKPGAITQNPGNGGTGQIWGSPNDPRLRGQNPGNGGTGQIWGGPNDPRLRGQKPGTPTGFNGQPMTKPGNGGTGQIWGGPNDPRAQQPGLGQHWQNRSQAIGIGQPNGQDPYNGGIDPQTGQAWTQQGYEAAFGRVNVSNGSGDFGGLAGTGGRPPGNMTYDPNSQGGPGVGGQNYGNMYPGYDQQGGQWSPNGQWNQGGPGVGPNNQLPGYSAWSPYGQALGGGYGPGGVPQTGLIGSEAALNQGQYGSERAVFGGMLGAENALGNSLQGGLGALGQGWNRAQGAMNGYLQTAAGPLEQFVPAGAQSQQIQAALSGALGPEAQAQAFQNYKDSPGQDWLQQQGERAVTRNAAALGGLGGGNVMQELQKQGQGLAQQDFQNQWGRLNDLTGQGLDAAGMLGTLYGNAGNTLAGVAGNLGMAGADLHRGVGADLANNRYQTGLTIGAGRYGTGQQLAAGRTQAGRDIANNVSGTSSALADLVNNQGSGLSDLLGLTGGNLANLLAGYGGDQAGSVEGLAELLAKIRQTGSGQGAGQPSLGGPVNTGGWMSGIGDAASGIGTLMMASDRRLKTNIRRVGETPGGTNLYTWDWTATGRQIAGDQLGYGVIADEVPGAAVRGSHGYMMVDYSKVT